jgi:hypothetical protein
LWKVTTADAHSWPELYIRGAGWLRFEPTPGGPTGQGTAATPHYGAAPGTGALVPAKPGGGTNPARNLPPGLSRQAFSRIHRLFPSAAGPSPASRHSIVPQILLAVLIVIVLALLTPMTARSVLRRRRLTILGRAATRPQVPGLDAEVAHAAWAELRDSMADYGLPGRVSESPRAIAGRVAATLHLDPAARQALDRIAGAEEHARYARVPLGQETLRADTIMVRRALSQDADRAAWWRARLLPASTLGPIRHGLQNSLDVFGWMDVAGVRVRDRIRLQG